jgi:hypothetical protein
MEPFPAAVGRDTVETTTTDESEGDAKGAETDPQSSGSDNEGADKDTEGHVCDPRSPVPCQFQ